MINVVMNVSDDFIDTNDKILTISRFWTDRFLFLDGGSVSRSTGCGGGGGGSSVGGSTTDTYRQSSSASPRGIGGSGGYCGSSASTPHSHSTSGSYSVPNPYTGSPTLYTSRMYINILIIY